MKKTLLLLIAIIYLSAANAQDAKKVFGSTVVIWYGMDFTKARMIGFKDESPHTIRDTYFGEWNNVGNEVDLAKTFHKNGSVKDMKGVTKANLARETEALTTNDDKDLSPAALAEMVKQVNAGQKKDGLGVMFIVQSFNKTADLATVHCIFFDISSRAILLDKVMTARPASGSTSKAWAAALKTIFSNIEKKDFMTWKKEANY